MPDTIMTLEDAHFALLGVWSQMEREEDEAKRRALAAKANRYERIINNTV